METINKLFNFLEIVWFLTFANENCNCVCFVRINLEEEFERDMDEIENRSSSDESNSDSSSENMMDNSIETKCKLLYLQFVHVHDFNDVNSGRKI